MKLGRESDFTDEAIHLCTIALKYMAADHPNDERIKAAARRAQLIAITHYKRVQLELRNPESDILRDRIAECAACEYHTHGKGCDRCEKYGSAIAKAGYIKKYLGEEAYQLMEQYTDEMQRKLGDKG